MGDLSTRATNLYSTLSLIPSIENAFIVPSSDSSSSQQVLIRASQTDLALAKKRTFIISKSIQQEGTNPLTFSSSPFPFDITNGSLFSPSPSGKYLAVVRIDADKKDEPFIEIWESYRLVHNVSCKGKGHGGIYADEWFGALEWSPDEKYVAYIAEPTVVNYSFWDKDCKDPSKRGHKFDFREDWGEAFTGLSNPSVFLLDVEKENIIAVELEDKKLSVGQVVWSPDGSELLFTGWPVSHRRLGLKYCYNRESAIYKVSVSEVIKAKQAESNTEDKTKADATSNVKYQLVSEAPVSRSARFPRFSPDGKTLVYFSGENIITHNGAFKLLKVDWATKQTSTVVDIVNRPKDEEAFPGLFVHAFPRRCFLDSTHILTHTQWRTALVPVVIDLTNGQIQRLKIPEPFFSAVVTDVVGGSFLMISSSPAVPQSLVYGKFNGSGFSSENLSTWTIHKSQSDILQNIGFMYKQVSPSAKPLDLTFDIIFVHPKTANEKYPLLLFPHGGPHSAFTGEYSLYVSFLVLMGYSVLMINYRGSVGFGSDFLNVLPGRCGELDVSDCVDAGRYVLGLDLVDKERVAVIGGSHGGFLASHLIGGSFDQLNFKACIMRNPVTDIVGMSPVTDIPDWCLVETGATRVPTMVPTLDQIIQMHKSSPIVNVDKIKTPTLFLLGEVDRRVPPSQGFALHYALLERNVPSQIMVYPKNGHALAGPDADPDQAVQTILFLDKYIN